MDALPESRTNEPGAPGPRRFWPPPGAACVRRVVVERVPAAGPPSYAVEGGGEPEILHLRALRWLLDEYPREERPPGAEVRVVLEIASTRLLHGRVGHAYALDGGPLGRPGADAPRGLLWRYVRDRLAART